MGYKLSVELEGSKSDIRSNLERISDQIRDGYLAGEGWDLSESE